MICDKIKIRDSKKSDQKSIRKIVKSSFEREAEANLVAPILPNTDQTISLIAECDNRPIGHVLMTNIGAPFKAMAIAPLAVIPKYREMQVGSQLIREAIQIAKKKNIAAIFTSGDPLFYERFGFSSLNTKYFTGNWQSALRSNILILEIEPELLNRIAISSKNKINLVYPDAFFNF